MDTLGKLIGNQGFLENLPYVILVTVALIGLLIFRVVWKSMVTRKVRRLGLDSGMSMMEIDRMRKKGIIDETEYRRIRSALAHHEVARNEDQQRIAKERAIIAQIEANPELARELIEPRPGERPRPPLNSAPPSPPQPGRPGALAEPSYPVGDPGQWPDPLARTPPPQAPAPPSKPSDLDLLLAKGAISKEEYARLKKLTE